MDDGFIFRQVKFDIIDKPKNQGAKFNLNVIFFDFYQVRASHIFQNIDQFLPGLASAAFVTQRFDKMGLILAQR
jgi:hypothetical protein